MNNRIKKITEKISSHPATVGLVLMLSFGLIFTTVIWPFDIPDEPNHFIRAYEISDGNLFSTTQTEDFCHAEHGNIDKSQNKAISVPASIQDFSSHQGERNNRLSQFSVDLAQDQRVSTCLRQTNANSPVGYLPQAAVIWVLKLFNAPPILMLFAARIAILTTWSLLLFFAIKIIPIRKWAIVGIALIPLAVQQSISIGADVLSIAPAVLLMAIIVRSHFVDRLRFYKKDVIVLVALVVIASLAKPVMLLLIIPMLTYKLTVNSNTKKILGLQQQRLVILACATIPLIIYGMWSLIANINDVSVNDIFALAAIKSDHGLLSLIPKFVEQVYAYVMSGLSAQQFGSLLWFTNTVPAFWNYLGIVALFIYLFVGYDQKYIIGEASKKIILNNWLYYLTAIGLIFANIFTLYIIWTPIDSSTIEGVQFRYFLSAFMIVASAYGRRYVQTSERWFIGFVVIMSVLFFLASLFALRG